MKKFLPFSGIFVGGVVVLVGFFGVLFETFVSNKPNHDLLSIPLMLTTIGVGVMLLNALGLAIAAVLLQAKDAGRYHR